MRSQVTWARCLALPSWQVLYLAIMAHKLYSIESVVDPELHNPNLKIDRTRAKIPCLF